MKTFSGFFVVVWLVFYQKFLSVLSVLGICLIDNIIFVLSIKKKKVLPHLIRAVNKSNYNFSIYRVRFCTSQSYSHPICILVIQFSADSRPTLDMFKKSVIWYHIKHSNFTHSEVEHNRPNIQIYKHACLWKNLT